MITCSNKQLDFILKQLQQVVMKLNLTVKDKAQENNENAILCSIKQYVSLLYDQLVNNQPTKTNKLEPQGQFYGQIEKDLQKQQNLNRLLIRRELQFKEYQKCLADELSQEKKSVKKLKTQITKYSEKIVSKDMEIMHLSTQKKILSKDHKSKQYLPLQALLNDKKNIEGLGSLNKNFLPDFKLSHLRRRSDDISKKPTTANPKKKGSVTKR